MVAELLTLDIRLTADGERLLVNAPKGLLDDTLRKRISDAKPALLALLDRAKTLSPRADEPIRRATTHVPVPLSFAQERIWFREQFEPGSRVFNLCRAVKITGELQVAALATAINEIRRRHETLRTIFYQDGGRVFQRTTPYRPLALRIVDLSKRSKEDRRRISRRLIATVVRRRFCLSDGHLLRVKLVRLGAREHLLALCTHHIVADAWSMGILGEELWSHYQAYASGLAAKMPELAVQYREYALWQRRERSGTAIAELQRYWRKQLAEMPRLELPKFRARPKRRSFRAGRQPIILSESLTSALNDLSRRENATLFMTLLAGFLLLLYRYTGQDDIVVGSPVANRELRELEPLIGLLVNILPLRVDCSGAPSFRELLCRVRTTCLDGYAHQELPFEEIVATVKPQRELDRQPLVQAMFVLQNTPRPSVAPGGLRLEPVEVANDQAQFDLSLYLRERAGRVQGFLEYTCKLFDEPAMGRLAGHFVKLLESGVANPEASIAALSMLGESERRELIVELNDTAAEFPDQLCIHQLFERRALRTPEAVAVVSQGCHLTFGELNRRSNRLANFLRCQGMGPERFVGILIDRSLEMVVGLLGILKAGAAYVPLDTDYPQRRLEFMAEDAQVGLLITKKKLLEDRGWQNNDRDAPSFLCHSRLRVLYLDEDWQVISRQSDENPVSGVSPENPAYVIYTSGSTGSPKGVVALHRGAVNRFAWMWRRYPFRAHEICCSKTSLSFVDSVWEIFGPLLQGVPLVIAATETVKEPQRLMEFLAAHRVTRIVLVPSLLKALLDATPALKRKLPELLFWICSGEVLTKELAQRFKTSHPRARLLNLYGSSEVAADVTCFEYSGQTCAGSVPLGRPIDNTQVYLLDARLQPVPTGVIGELYVGGAGLARGYWNRRELNAAKFVANPFCGENHSRLYRTGDLGRYLADGNIEYCGRIDRQIKIRGQRVEQGEIEAVLRTHPAVGDCAVLAWAAAGGDGEAREQFQNQNSSADIQLVAYLVAKRSPLPSGTELKGFLKNNLPDFMLPSDFVELAALPRLPNGKLDRRALPRPACIKEHGEEKRVAPRTEIEAWVAQVWCDALKLESIDVTANFFGLGGHSLLGAEIVAKLGALFNRPLPLRELFEAPTVAGLSARIGKTLRRDDAFDLPPILPRPHVHRAPLTLGQERLFLFSQLFGGGDFLNLPYAYRLIGALDRAAIERTIEAIINRHEILRTSFVEVNGRAIQRIGRQRKFRLRTIDLSPLAAGDAAAQLARISRVDAAKCFDVGAAPLMRVRLIRMTEQEHVLLVTLHHLIADQWSMGVLRRELTEIYGAFARGLALSLPDLPIQFGDFAAWQRGLIEQRAFHSEIAYWRNQLAAPRQKLDFQPGTKRHKASRFQSARRPIEIDERLFAAIKEFAGRHGCTPFIILIAGLMILLHKITGQRDIRIATLVANRNQPGTQGLIGYFVNALVLRTQVNADLRSRELLERVRLVCLEAYAHQQVPFEDLEAALGGAKPGVPLFQVMLNYRIQGPAPRDRAGLTIASWHGEHRAANPGIDISRLDLNFHLREASTKLTGIVNFRVDLFDARGIAEMMDGFRNVLVQLITHPERKVSKISLC